MEISTTDIEIEFLKKDQIDLIKPVNRFIFNEERIINTTSHSDLIVLRACIKDITIGFKVGYGKRNGIFYSAKGGVLPNYRRMGLAKKMLDEMLDASRLLGYSDFQYDTFPNMNKGMLIMGLNNGFSVIEAKYNAQYKDFQITLSKKMG